MQGRKTPAPRKQLKLLKRMQKDNKKATIVAIVFLLFLTVLFIHGFYYRQQIKENKCISVGVIVDRSGNTRGGDYYDYKFSYNTIVYKGAYSNGFASDLRGYKFPVVFNCNNPHQSIMLITPNKFREYGYNFPDSLRKIYRGLRLKQ